jgi:hypothetical protein
MSGKGETTRELSWQKLYLTNPLLVKSMPICIFQGAIQEQDWVAILYGIGDRPIFCY